MFVAGGGVLCFEIGETRKNGIPLDRLRVDDGFRMALRMDHSQSQHGHAIYLEESWNRQYLALSEKYTPEQFGSMRLKRAAFADKDELELVHEPKFGKKSKDWNSALVLILTGAGPGVRVKFEVAGNSEILYDGMLEKLVTLKPGTGFKITRFGSLEEDQKKHLAFFWDWDLRLREVPIYYPKHQRRN